MILRPQAVDPGGAALTFSSDLLPPGAALDPKTGAFTWTPDFTQAGSYPGVTLTANDGHGGTASASFAITVTNTNRAPVVTAIADQTIAEGATLTVTPRPKPKKLWLVTGRMRRDKTTRSITFASKSLRPSAGTGP